MSWPVFHHTAGCLAAQPPSASSSAASEISKGSLLAGPMSCTPIGSPSEVKPAGTLTDGQPRTFHGHVTGHVEGAETTSDVVARMVPALREIWDATGPAGTSVVVAHGACTKVSLLAFLGWPETLSGTLRGLDNCGWAVLEADAHGRGIRLASYNETAHPAVHGPDFASDAPVG